MNRLPVLLLPFLLFATESKAEIAQTRPNLIVVMVDDLGYAGLSCFGNPYFETPEIDRFAAEGMRLTEFHTSGTVCSPTRAGLLTGRYQQRAGIEAVIHPQSDHPEHRKGLQRSEITFASALRDSGYATGLVGKWHLGYPQNSEDYHPQNHGFDEFVGYHSGNVDYVSHIGDHNEHDWWHGRDRVEEDGYATHLINRHAVEFIRRHGGGERPFCLYVSHLAIHNPVQVPGDPVRRTTEGWVRWPWQEATEVERIEKFRGMTLPVDEGMGQIRAALVELGIAEDTFVLFFSDNGPSAEFPSGSPTLRGGKGTVYEGGHKVPSIAWWPGRIEAGAESSETMMGIDVMPTLLSLAGAVAPERTMDGIDLSPALLRREALAPRELFWASLSNRGQRSEAMRDGPWKLVVQHPGAPPGTFENETLELYHLDDDPGEQTDLSAQESIRAAEMAERLRAWYAETVEDSAPQEGGWLAPPPP